MAFGGAPGDDPNHTCDAVLDNILRLETFNRQRVVSGKRPLKTRCALHHGYSALGDVVNTASRLENAAKELGVQTIVSHEVAMNAVERHRFLRLSEITIRGKTTPIEAFKFDAIDDSLRPQPLELVVKAS